MRRAAFFFPQPNIDHSLIPQAIGATLHVMSFIDTASTRRFSADKMQKLNLFETPNMFCDIYCLEPGQSQKPHSHADATKFYYVIEGRGAFQLGDRHEPLATGGLAFAAPGEIHGVENTSDQRLVLLVAMAPNPNNSRA